MNGRCLPVIVLCVICLDAKPLFGETKGLPQVGPETALQNAIENFETGYSNLKLPQVELEYIKNLKNIPDIAELKRRESFLEGIRTELSGIALSKLKPESQIVRSWLLYLVEESIENVRLEQDYREAKTTNIPDDGLFRLPHHDQWYSLYARRFSSRQVNPAEIRDLGNREIEKVKGEIVAIQKKLGYEGKDSEFYTHLNLACCVNFQSQSMQPNHHAIQGLHLLQRHQTVPDTSNR